MVDDPNKTESGLFIDDDYLAADEPSAETSTSKQSFKEIWQQNPSVKIFAIVAGIAILLIGFMVFGGSESGKPSEEEVSAMRSTPDVSQAPGTAELPPAYEEAVRASNEQIAQQAENTGGSAIPTPIARPSERIEAPAQVEETDPLSEWRREAETRRIERQRIEEEQAVITPPPLPAEQNSAIPGQNGVNGNAAEPPPPPLPTTPSAEQVSAIAQQMQQAMQTYMDAQTPKDSVVVSMNIQPAYDMEKYFPSAGQTQTGQPNDAQNAALQQQQMQKPPKPIISAGSIVYAQILTEANSDVPGPVLAEIASGPLIGGRAIGTFQVAQRHLVLTFNRIVKDGVEYPVQAFALDPATTLPGVVSDIDNHYLQRILLPAAAAFIEGFSEAATQTDTEVVVSNGTVVSDSTNDLDTREELMKGAQEAGNKLSEIVDQNADRPRTIVVHAGTRVGLLFMSAVLDPQQQQNMYAQQQQPGQQPQNMGRAIFNATPYGQAYNAYQAYQQSNPYGGQTAANGQVYNQGQQRGLFTNTAGSPLRGSR